MTTYLFTTAPTNDLGLLTRALPIARELRAAGHRVLFCSPARAPSQLIRDAAFENPSPRHALFDALAARPGVLGMLRLLRSKNRHSCRRGLLGFFAELIPAIPAKKPPRTTEIWNADHAGAVLGLLNAGFIRAYVAALRTLIAEHCVDIVVDFWNPMAAIAARAADKPLVTVIQSDAHPQGQGFIWWKGPPAQLPTCTHAINQVLDEIALPLIAKLEDLSVGDLTLVVGTPDLDPLPANLPIHYIGPLVWQADRAELPTWISNRNRDVPLIWVYSGNPRYSSGDGLLDSQVVLEASIAALAHQDVLVALTTGHHVLPKQVRALPSNMRHQQYLPGLAMAAECDLLIHHGGYGSCQTGLYTGKPAVILPTFAERESNARRVAAAGAGIMIPVSTVARKKCVDIDALGAAVRTVLSEERFASRAREISRHLRAYGGAARAAELILDFTGKTGR